MTNDGKYECDVEKVLLDNGYEGTVFLTNFSYDTALAGVSQDGRAIYDYNLMVEWLMEEEGFDDDIEAMEWIDYNTLGALPYFPGAPVVFFSKDYEEQTAAEYIEDHCLDGVKLVEGLDECFLGMSSSDLPVYDFDLAEMVKPGITDEDFSSWEAPPVFLKRLNNIHKN